MVTSLNPTPDERVMTKIICVSLKNMFSCKINPFEFKISILGFLKDSLEIPRVISDLRKCGARFGGLGSACHYLENLSTYRNRFHHRGDILDPAEGLWVAQNGVFTHTI